MKCVQLIALGLISYCGSIRELLFFL